MLGCKHPTNLIIGVYYTSFKPHAIACSALPTNIIIARYLIEINNFNVFTESHFLYSILRRRSLKAI